MSCSRAKNIQLLCSIALAFPFNRNRRWRIYQPAIIAPKRRVRNQAFPWVTIQLPNIQHRIVYTQMSWHLSLRIQAVSTSSPSCAMAADQVCRLRFSGVWANWCGPSEPSGFAGTTAVLQPLHPIKPVKSIICLLKFSVFRHQQRCLPALSPKFSQFDEYYVDTPIPSIERFAIIPIGVALGVLSTGTTKRNHQTSS